MIQKNIMLSMIEFSNKDLFDVKIKCWLFIPYCQILSYKTQDVRDLI